MASESGPTTSGRESSGKTNGSLKANGAEATLSEVKHEEDPERVAEAERAASERRALRAANMSPQYPDTAFLKSLDSSIKKNTAVMKKLKQMSEEGKDVLLQELKAVNLTKYVSEAVNAISEARLKNTDLPAAIQVCCLLHQRYKDFSTALVAALVKALAPGRPIDDGDGLDRSSRLHKKRMTLRLLVELYICAVYNNVSVLTSMLKELIVQEHLKDREATQVNLPLVLNFAKTAKDTLGLMVDEEEAKEKPTPGDVSLAPEARKSLLKMLTSYLEGILQLLHNEHTNLKELEKENARVLATRGQLTEEASLAYEKQRKWFDQLLRGAASLAEALDKEPPALLEDQTSRITEETGAGKDQRGESSGGPEPLWDDEDTRLFYEGLPDIRAFVPAALLGEAEPKADGKAAENGEGEEAPEDQSQDGHKKEEGGVEGASGSTSEKDRGKGAANAAGEGVSLDSVLQRLTGAASRDKIDQLTVDFCYLNSKAHRRKLVRVLFAVPRTSLELLPHYSRMVATLAQIFKDVGPSLVGMLEEEFQALINKKDQMNIETKIRNIRFLGELCKFRVAPPAVVFACLRAALDDFTHHNIDVACNLLETCGRFLLRSPETSVRMSNLLDVLLRLKNIKNLGPRHATLVDNAYFMCKPPERPSRIVKVQPPLQQYIRKLMLVDLDKTTADRVLRQLRKLPWGAEPAVFGWVQRSMLKVHRVRFSHVHVLASLAAGLSRYHDALTVSLVDQVLEEVRLGLETVEFSRQQRRIALMHFLGELYNYRVVDSPIIFDTLYLILFFGQDTPEAEVLDPPDDTFRIRLVIMMLQTCGRYFDRGASRRRLDRFLLYFQRYILSKGSLPMDLDFDLQDLFVDLRPKLVRFSSLEEAHAAIWEMEQQELSVEGAGAGGGAAAEEGQDGGGGDGAESDDGSERRGEHRGRLDEDKDGDESKEGEDGDEGQGQVVGLDDDDDNVKVMKSEAARDPEEDQEFERELRALMQESVDARKQERGVRPLNMTVPLNLLRDGAGGGEGPGGVGEGTEDVVKRDVQGSRAMAPLRVIVKKGGKQQARQLEVPAECSLLVSTQRQDAAEVVEKQDIKRLVLEYNSREEESGEPLLFLQQQQQQQGDFSWGGGRGGGGRGRGGVGAVGRGPGGPAAGYRPRGGAGGGRRR